ncbi:uncharacterized protein [Blastocystis hominis]|uniref:Uncharacterized protein n=1 Tax=Blastocystis hominis TaxID=12968 RepID=D8MBH4_BLAHO|nr:uncharacterized protein [Blastocystis hominis]CBK25413.2 unnamed protein product [Blastocystis hominis]|eukprot:XP_012899461.1 uncharacterized protein [Blastocystis hominis]
MVWSVLLPRSPIRSSVCRATSFTKNSAPISSLVPTVLPELLDQWDPPDLREPLELLDLREPLDLRDCEDRWDLREPLDRLELPEQLESRVCGVRRVDKVDKVLRDLQDLRVSKEKWDLPESLASLDRLDRLENLELLDRLDRLENLELLDRPDRLESLDHRRLVLLDLLDLRASLDRRVSLDLWDLWDLLENRVFRDLLESLERRERRERLVLRWSTPSWLRTASHWIGISRTDWMQWFLLRTLWMYTVHWIPRCSSRNGMWHSKVGCWLQA